MKRYIWDKQWEADEGKWTIWHPYAGFKRACLSDGLWDHYLLADASEQDPDRNHIHYKFKVDSSGHMHSFVLCSMKVDGMRELNRRNLIQKINSVTGLNLEYK